MSAFGALGVLALFAGLVLTPLGAPGNWIMIGVLAVGVWLGQVGLTALLAAALVAGAAEVVEFLLVRRLSLQYGGSPRAFWGAIGGGIIGVLAGFPVPVIGSVIAGFLGSFIGAALVTIAETRRLHEARRVGWGVLLGRMWAAAVKTAAGIIILVIGAAALLR